MDGLIVYTYVIDWNRLNSAYQIVATIVILGVIFLAVSSGVGAAATVVLIPA